MSRSRRSRRPPLPILHRLWVKLLVAFILVAAVAVGVVGVLANRTTARQFELYVSQGKQMRAGELIPLFAAYYARVGSWEGVEAWMTGLDELSTGGRGQGRGSSSDRLLLADSSGRVVADTGGELKGEQLSEAQLALGTPIEVGGQQVGTLLVSAAEGAPQVGVQGAPHESLEAEFLEQVNRSLVWAGLAAGALALGLGLLLARQLTAPLRSLTDAVAAVPDAAHHLAGGQVPQVEVRSRDEIGELAGAFNQMAQSLARQETLRRNLMADIAHELRTPLTVIRGDLEALLDGVFEPTPEALASLQEETLLLSRLVDDLRALAQAEAGQLKLERQPTDLAGLLQGVMDSFDLQAGVQGQRLILDLPPELPLVDADPQRVRQVVANLVSNALRHAPGSGRVAVSARQYTTAGQASDEVQVSVADDGPGIAPKDLPHVFDRFWQADWAGRKATGGSSTGSGLGLAIARELVRAHGGRIWAESREGRGSTFAFTLPLAGGRRQEGGRP